MNKISIAALPTPIMKLEKLSKELNKNIWVKRDDLTGIECSGNKVRKLEYIFNDLLDKNCDIVITCGGEQSNHCRATASVAAKLGLRCILFLAGVYAEEQTGNLFLDKLLGAEIKYVPESDFANTRQIMEKEAENLTKQGCKPYIIPLGASNALGSHGYIEAYNEIAKYEADNSVCFDTIAVSVGSGGTYAGILAGAVVSLGNEQNPKKREIIGINVSSNADYFEKEILGICESLRTEYNMELSITNDDIHIIDGYVGPGYGVPSAEVIEVITHLARKEGIVLDPTYTGKAFWGLLSEIKKGTFSSSENILFLHTGGIFGIFAQINEFIF